MKKGIKKGILTLGLVLSLFATAHTAVYALEYVELAPLPGTCETRSNGTCVTDVGASNLGNYINSLYKLAVAAAGVLAVLMIVMGGFSYISTDAISNKEEGKHQIKMALGGLMVVFASYIILNTINPQLVELNIVSEKLNASDVNFTELTMMSREVQKNFDTAMSRSLENFDKLKKETDQIRKEASDITQATKSYRELDEIKTLLEKGDNLDLEQANKLQILKDSYYFGKTDEEIKKSLETKLPQIEEKLKESTKTNTIDQALRASEDQAKKLIDTANMTSITKGVEEDFSTRLERFKIKQADSKLDTSNDWTSFWGVETPADKQYQNNPENIKSEINSIKGVADKRIADINSLKNIDSATKEKAIADIKKSAETTTKKICDEIPQTITKAVGSGDIVDYTVENNPAYEPCKN